MYHTYILLCADNTLYTGITTDIGRRVEEHNGTNGQKHGAKYTAARQPVVLKYSESFKTRSEALKRELEIKALSKAEKQKLIDSSATL